MDMVGPLQLRVLDFMWDNGPATVNTVVEHLNAVGPKKVAYTTALTVMRNLVRRRVCVAETGGRAHVFSPTLTRLDYQLGILKHVRDTLFAGDADKMYDAMTKPEFSSERATSKTKTS